MAELGAAHPGQRRPIHTGEAAFQGLRDAASHSSMQARPVGAFERRQTGLPAGRRCSPRRRIGIDSTRRNSPPLNRPG